MDQAGLGFDGLVESLCCSVLATESSTGPDGESIRLEAASLPENGALLNMNPGIDHADETIHGCLRLF